MTVQELCKRIELQDCVAERVNAFVSSYDFASIDDILKEMSTPQTAEAGYQKLAGIFTEDENQIKMLACHLVCAARQYDNYQAMGISDQIYDDTYKCFTRFIGECKVKTGKHAFDRAWWTYRQVSMVLFRIGDLEYELLVEDGKKVVSVHIPSDSKFGKENVDESLELAKEFISKCYPEYNGCDFVCDSWLLSPKLKKVLDENSKIINFQNRFQITKVDEEAKDIFEWVFKTSEDSDINSLSEETSLQRKLKQLLLKGENVGIGIGVLK